MAGKALTGCLWACGNCSGNPVLRLHQVRRARIDATSLVRPLTRIGTQCRLDRLINEWGTRGSRICARALHRPGGLTIPPRGTGPMELQCSSFARFVVSGSMISTGAHSKRRSPARTSLRHKSRASPSTQWCSVQSAPMLSRAVQDWVAASMPLPARQVRANTLGYCWRNANDCSW